MKDLGIIIQARSNSSRLPNKVVLPFYKNKGILELIIEKLKNTNYKIFIATTINKDDDVIEQIALKNNLQYFRGSEKNVLSRFIRIAQENNLKYVLRVCSDNPFINIRLLEKMILKLEITEELDYVGYFNKKDNPLIVSHFGLFSELISLKAMLKISNLKINPIYFEHVTNYIYENPSQFKIEKIIVPKIFESNDNIRLTVDDKTDFEITSSIFKSFKGDHDSYEDLIYYIVNNTNYRKIMGQNIKKNKK